MQQIGLIFKDNTSGMLILKYTFYGAEAWALQKVYQKYLDDLKCGARKG
jgi:hypothetical protein